MTTGKLIHISTDTNIPKKEHEIEWKISAFSSLPQKDDSFFNSPLFSFNNESWYLKMKLTGPQQRYALGFIGLYLMRSSSGGPINMDYTLGIKAVNGRKYSEHNRWHAFTDDGFGVHACITRTELFIRRYDLMPDDEITLFCNLKYPEHEEDTKKCSYCKLTVDAREDLPSHQQKCMDKPVKCPDCSDVVALKNWYDHECEKTQTEASENRSCNSNIYKYSETILKVEEDFILAA